MSIWVTNAAPLELKPNASESDLQNVITGVYKHVLGNHHIMDSQRLESAESLLRNGDINVRGFVRAVAKSDLYRSYFFESSSPYSFIEKNFHNLLGRAPDDQAEVAAHTISLQELGYNAEIDSYIDSDEYWNSFGEHTVPYLRGHVTEVGAKTVRFNRTLNLTGGNAQNVAGKRAKLTTDLGVNLPTKVRVPKSLGLGQSGTGGRFRIVVEKANNGNGRNPRSKASYEIGFAQMSTKIQTIHKFGGKIVSIALI
ncbi:MAG: phycobilisome rod-core linker polypeptide [Cyanobacteria bacterium P01_D01_bin.105]